MNRHSLAAAGLALLTLAASPALAEQPVMARLAQPLAQKAQFIAGGAMFQCEADLCAANSPTAQTFSLSVCQAVAAKAGPVTAFSARLAFDDPHLAKCNSQATARSDRPLVAAK